MKSPLPPLLFSLLLALTAGLAPQSRAEAGKANVSPEIEKLYAWMSGAFSSEAQSEAQPSYFHVTLHMVPIWQERKEERWLYVEQAMASKPERPYRQRVYRLTTDANGGIISRVFTLPGDALTYAGAWKKPALLAELKPENLTEREGCEILLNAESAVKFTGSTTAKSCGSELNGASYATSKVEITERELRSWDQGFDTSDTQVWGAREGPYIFLKLTTPADRE